MSSPHPSAPPTIPVLGPGHTHASITDKISDIVLQFRAPIRWFLGFLVGFTLLQGELPLAMARDGTFPRWFAKVSRREIPVRGLILSSLLSTILLAANASRTMSGLFAFMALLATSAALVLYLACALAVLRLQWTGAMGRSLPLTLIAALGTIYALWTMRGAGPEATGWGTVLLLVGIPVYVAMRLTNSRAARRAASPE